MVVQAGNMRGSVFFEAEARCYQTVPGHTVPGQRRGGGGGYTGLPMPMQWSKGQGVLLRRSHRLQLALLMLHAGFICCCLFRTSYVIPCYKAPKSYPKLLNILRLLLLSGGGRAIVPHSHDT